MLVTKRVKFSGRVQGVNFRRKTQAKARELGVNGWVKNVVGGTVEAMFSGIDKDVEKLINYCLYEMPMTMVTKYDISEEKYQAFSSFEIIF